MGGVGSAYRVSRQISKGVGYRQAFGIPRNHRTPAMLASKVEILACSIVCWALSAASAIGDVRFEKLTINEGYPGTWPISLAQDHQGFLWIADIDVGLIRYDGYEFRSYRLDRSHPGSITSNETSFVHVDPSGTLWIATNAGLDRYDARSDQFTAITTRSTDPAGLSHDNIGFALTDSKGRLWIGTQQGLNRLDPGANRFHQYHVTRGYRGPRQEPDYFWTGFEDSKGRLWFGLKVNGGLHFYDPQSDTLKQFIYDDSPQSPAAIGVRSIIEDRDGFIWVAGSALTRLDPDTMNFERFYLRSNTEYVNPLGLPDSPGTFWCMTEDSAGSLWIGTTTTGVILDLAGSQDMVRVRERSKRPALHSRRQGALNIDRPERSNLVWRTWWAQPI